MTEDAYLILARLHAAVGHLERSVTEGAVTTTGLLRLTLQVIISSAELARELSRANAANLR